MVHSAGDFRCFPEAREIFIQTSSGYFEACNFLENRTVGSPTSQLADSSSRRRNRRGEAPVQETSGGVAPRSVARYAAFRRTIPMVWYHTIPIPCIPHKFHHTNHNIPHQAVARYGAFRAPRNNFATVTILYSCLVLCWP